MKKKYSLKRNEEIAKIVHKRRFVKNEAFVMYYQPNSEVGHTRICISVSKKHGKAVIRNKIKRQVREMITALFDFEKQYDYVLIVRNAFLENDFCHLAFSNNDIERYGEIKARYMNERDVEKNTNPNALALGFIGKLKHWWIDADGLTINWKQTYSDNICYKNGFSCLIKKGIRPVIEMSAQQLR